MIDSIFHDSLRRVWINEQEQHEIIFQFNERIRDNAINDKSY
jgi:hypothetical protein